MNCTRCGKAIQETGALFCPFCGAPLATEAASPVPPGAAALLEKAARQQNNQKKLALLRQACEEYPECLPVQEEWLFQQKLPTTPAAALDYDGIKCHLLQMYLTPEAYTPEQLAARRAELFGHPQLLRCLALAPSPEGFTAHYLLRLCREYIQVFLMGSNEYMPRLLGFRLERDPAKALARPAARMLLAMEADTGLTPGQRQQLTAAFRDAFCAECGGDMSWLERALAQNS